MKPWISVPTAPGADDELGNRALRMLGLLDPEPSAELDALANVARAAFGVPIAMINIFEGGRLRFRARHGVEVDEIAREDSFSEIVRADAATLVVEDALADPRFAGLAAVTSDLGVRFYAGEPLRLRQADGKPGMVIGVVCIADSKPRRFSDEQRAVLRNITEVVETVVYARKALTDAIAIADERAQRGRQLRRADRQFRQAERMANMGSWRYSIADEAIEWSEQTFAIYGLKPGPNPTLAEAIEFYPPPDRAVISQALAHTMETGEPFDLEVDFISARGQPLRVRAIGELEMAGGAPVAVIGVFQDITERHHMEEALRRSASIDDLTRIANRATFGRMLEDRMEAARSSDGALALLLIDLDGYKAINDSHGHVAGDEVLRAVAQRIAAVPCADAFAARLGGDELALIFSDPASCARIEDIVAHLLGDIARPVPVDGKDIAVSGTIGVALFEPGVDTMRELVQRADMALYQAKREKRGTARIFGEEAPIEPAAEGRRTAA
jgi:diguanylate cyclase (GGDEF)-like protein